MSRKNTGHFNITFAMIIFLFISTITYHVIKFTTVETIEIIVNKTERVQNDENSKYLVFTENETFENTDDILQGKFNSSDIQGKFKENQTYEVKVWGWRIPILSKYRNIISIE